MRRHPSAETVAVYHEGLLARRKAARISAHLSRCPRCAMLGTELAGVTALLSAAGPPSLPPSLATRLDAVLASEATRAAAGAAPSGGPGPDAVPQGAGGGGAAGSGGAGRRTAAMRRPGPGRRRLAVRIASVVATVAALGGGGYALSQLASGTASGSSASSASSASARRAAPVPLSSRDLGAGRADQEASPGLTAGPSAAGLPVVESGTNYQPGRLRAQIVSVLDVYSHGPSSSTHGAPLRAAVGRTFPHLTACVKRVSDGHAVQLVDVARYAGRPAAVIVVRTGATWRAWVVGGECSATSSDVITRFLLPPGR